MKKTYVTPDVEILSLTDTECFEPQKKFKEILSSTGDVIGYEEVAEVKKSVKSYNHKSSGWGFGGWWPWW